MQNCFTGWPQLVHTFTHDLCQDCTKYNETINLHNLYLYKNKSVVHVFPSSA